MNSQTTSEQRTSVDVSISIIRWLGVLILIIGLYGGAQVVNRAWELLDNPSSIGEYAEKIENQSHLNSFFGQMNILVDFVEKAKRAIPDSPEEQLRGLSKPSLGHDGDKKPLDVAIFNASYFTAWGITIILLALIARVCFWAITAGGKLALYSVSSGEQLRQVRLELGQHGTK